MSEIPFGPRVNDALIEHDEPDLEEEERHDREVVADEPARRQTDEEADEPRPRWRSSGIANIASQ